MNPTPQSETPRTDAEQWPCLQLGRGPSRVQEMMVTLSFARALERELGEANRELKYLLSELSGAVEGLMLHPEKEDNGFYISQKSKEKLQVLKEIIKHYEQL